MLTSAGGYYAGQVDFGGKKRGRVELIDGNVNGAFNDRGAKEKATATPRWWLAARDGQRYLGKLLEVDGAFFRIEMARDGAFVNCGG